MTSLLMLICRLQPSLRRINVMVKSTEVNWMLQVAHLGLETLLRNLLVGILDYKVIFEKVTFE